MYNFRCLLYKRIIFNSEYIPIYGSLLGCEMTLNIHFVLNRYGPLIDHWTMRFEAKHRYFKQLANVLGNFTNICYSLSLRHQLYQCYLSLNETTLPGEELEIGPGM